MIKKIFGATGKILISGLCAFLLLTAFCFFYYNIPSHSESADGSTDYKWEEKTFYSRGTEGFALGRTNNEGYVNSFDFDEKNPVDILIMGSSHMEAFQVAMDESVAGRLGQLFDDRTVYNIGISGHSFVNCSVNLEAALKKYKPSFVVMETGTCLFSDEAFSGALDGTLEEIPAHTGGIAGTLQKNQYLRLLYAQIKNYMKKPADNQEEDTAPQKNDEATQNNDELLSKLLKKNEALAEQYGAKLIILYHPGTAIAPDGALKLVGNRDAERQFEEKCQENGIIFLDMSERFLKEYEKNSILPYGFINSPVGSGHLNRYGHAMIADELYRLISEVPDVVCVD